MLSRISREGFVEFTKWRTIVVLFVLVCILGCEKIPAHVQRIHSKDISYGYHFDPDSRQVSYFSGEYPLKTFFHVYDFASQSAQQVHFTNYSFEGHHVLLNRQYALANAFYLQDNDQTEQRLLLFDIANHRIVDEIVFPDDFVIIRMARPDWSQQVHILFKDDSQMVFYRTVDIIDNALRLSDTREIGTILSKMPFFFVRNPSSYSIHALTKIVESWCITFKIMASPPG
jgi:hypothetical protein